MNPTQVVVEGTLRPDGTLEVSERLHLQPGRVRVTVETIPESLSAPGTIGEVLDQIHQGQARRGFVGRTRDEIDADVSALRGEWDDRMRETERLQDDCRRSRESQAC